MCVLAAIQSATVVAAEGTTAGAVLEVPYVGAKATSRGSVFDIEEGGEFTLMEVKGCCDVAEKDNSYSPQAIGQMAQMNPEQTLQILEDAKQAWNGGMGSWPQMSLRERLDAMNRFLVELSAQRELIVQTLMWEIGKNRKDAEAEFDRTVEFCRKVMEVAQTDPEYVGGWQTIGSTKAFVRRAAIGIIMALGPMNYPLNETYATLIPALLMGNVAIMKIPTVGGLAHLLTSKYSMIQSTTMKL